MNSIFKIILLSSVLATTLYSCNNDQEGTAKQKANTTKASKDTSNKNSDLNLALFDSDSLIKNYQYSKEIDEKIRRKERSILANRDAKMKDFQEFYNTLNQQAPTMSQNEMMQAEQQLVQRQQQLDTEEQDTQRKYIDWKTNILQNYQNHLDSILELYRMENEIDVLVPSGGGLAKFYFDSSYDVTTDLIAYLNERYTKNSDKEPNEAE